MIVKLSELMGMSSALSLIQELRSVVDLSEEQVEEIVNIFYPHMRSEEILNLRAIIYSLREQIYEMEE